MTKNVYQGTTDTQDFKTSKYFGDIYFNNMIECHNTLYTT